MGIGHDDRHALQLELEQYMIVAAIYANQDTRSEHVGVQSAVSSPSTLLQITALTRSDKQELGSVKDFGKT